MDADRVAFVFGSDIGPEVFAELDDPSDLDERSLLYDELFPDDLEPAQHAVRQIVANQILDGEPPDTWATAQRLLAAGLDREDVFRQLAMVMAATTREMIASEERFDPARFAAALDRLPLPTAAELERDVLEIVRADQGLALDDLLSRVRQRSGGAEDDAVLDAALHAVIDHLIEEGTSLALLAGDRTVHPGDLTAGIVLTHRLAGVEVELGILPVAFDLAGLGDRDDLVLAGVAPIEVFSMEPGHLGWIGPEGWLDAFDEGDVMAIRIDGSGAVSVDAVDDPAVDEALVERVRAAYDVEVAEPWLPVRTVDLVLSLLLDDKDTFREPCAPLADLADRAGLERRLDEVAHDESVWHHSRIIGRMRRAHDAFDEDDDASHQVLHVLFTADVVHGFDAGDLGLDESYRQVDAAALRSVLSDLDDLRVLSFVEAELVAAVDDPHTATWSEDFIAALLEAASKPRHVAVARYLAARLSEVMHETLVAEQHLVLAEKADPEHPLIIDRLAWYAADRGDAERAARLWSRLEPNAAIEQDLAEIEPFARPGGGAGAEPGRNDPCWCGSGRKYKLCHRGELPRPPLPDRVGWLCRKAVNFLERRMDLTEDDVYAIAAARAQDPDDVQSLIEAFGDPLVIDLALTEDGWFDEFLLQRGPLLPDDEALLAESWLLVERTVYEVVDVEPGRRLTVRDLRTGDRLEVREQTLSREVRVSELLCARAVPDGETHQIVGGVFGVKPGTENAVLALLDDGDPIEIAAWVRELSRPPSIRIPDGTVRRVDELVDEWGGDGDEPGDGAGLLDPDDPEVAQILADHRAEMERRWCDEPVPALGGRTPRECADDPTRRPELERLIVSFERAEERMPAGGLTFRPDVLRELLGL